MIHDHYRKQWSQAPKDSRFDTCDDVEQMLKRIHTAETLEQQHMQKLPIGNLPDAGNRIYGDRSMLLITDVYSALRAGKKVSLALLLNGQL